MLIFKAILEYSTLYSSLRTTVLKCQNHRNKKEFGGLQGLKTVGKWVGLKSILRDFCGGGTALHVNRSMQHRASKTRAI